MIRILILDDYRENRERMVALARLAGMAAQGCATLDEFRAALESGQNHVVSLDMNLGMGHAKDRIVAINCIANQDPGMLVIVHSNSPKSREEMMRACGRLGIKAIDMEAFGWDAAAVRKAAEEHRGSAS